ncbi:NUDIX hydrolase [Streptomyces sp. NPDC051554]|uniref:NUDIX hydrolase n=1 Tax=Streptomyces sp. NPDC051554 TaxID=3365656 RepID=UPI0037A77311
MPKPGSYVLGATCVAFEAHGRVLLNLRRSPERWELPGGLVETGEAIHDAAERETFEEIGVVVRVRGLIGMYQHPSRGILAGLFVADHVTGEPGPSDESIAAEWLQVETALERLHPLYKPRLQDVLAAERTATLRIHEGQRQLAQLLTCDNLAAQRGSRTSGSRCELRATMPGEWS